MGMEKKREKKCGVGLGVGIGVQSQMLDLPLHILCDIIVKLPPCSVIRCGSVCKTLRDVVTDSRFHQLYLSTDGPISFVVLSDHRRLLCLDSCADDDAHHAYPSSSLASLNIIPSSSSLCRSGTDPIHIHNLSPNPNPNPNPNPSSSRSRSRSSFIALQSLGVGPLNLVNSSNGLLCLRSSTGYPNYYFVCNPLLGEILTLPPPLPSSPTRYVRFSAFGFDPLSKRYKIVRLVFKPNINKTVVELYQLGDATWRVIGYAPTSATATATARRNSVFDPSLNGALHWVTPSLNQDNNIISSISELICSFDLHTNHFKWVPPPSHFDVDFVNKLSAISVGVLKGCLCLCYVNGDAKFETWLMREYGVQQSWTNAFSIDINSYCGLRLQDKHRPIGFTSYGDMWLKADSDSDSNSHCLVSYSAQTSAFKVIDISGISSNVEATPHILSFVSLKDIVNVTDTHLQFHRLIPKRS